MQNIVNNNLPHITGVHTYQIEKDDLTMEHFNKADKIIEDIQQTTNKVKELLAKAEEINKKLS